MEVLGTAEIFLFEGFHLDRREGLSRRDEQGAFIPVAICPRALNVLAVLVSDLANSSGKRRSCPPFGDGRWSRTPT